MVEDAPARPRRWPAWAATAVLTLLTLGTAFLYEFGCAVGEYEEDNHTCDASTYPLIGFAALVVGLVAARLLHRKELRWLGYAAAVVMTIAGWNYA